MVGNVLVLHPQDNVGNAVADIEALSLIIYQSGNQSDQSNQIQLVANQAIPFGFKVAIQPIALGEVVIKYGAAIGRATAMIRQGDLVHVHNLEGQRGRGDRRCQENSLDMSDPTVVPASEMKY
jgi:altronate dehydratase small subunit